MSWNLATVAIICLIFLHLAASVSAKKLEKESVETTNEVEDSSETGTIGNDAGGDVSHGFGIDIDWVAWPEAIPIALDLDKPIFLLIHKTWCGACQSLKRSFNTSSKRIELVELSKKFVMVNTEDDEEPEEDLYAPDGGYIPRLFLLKKNGDPLPVHNKENYPQNIAYFPQVPDVVKAMKQALKLLEDEPNSESSLKTLVEPEGPPKSEQSQRKEAEKVVKEPTNEDGKKKPKDDKSDEKNLEKRDQKMPAEKKGEATETEESKSAGGGCPHAAGKAAAKKKAEEDEKMKKKKRKSEEAAESSKKVEKENKSKKNPKKTDAKDATNNKEDPKKAKNEAKEKKNTNEGSKKKVEL